MPWTVNDFPFAFNEFNPVVRNKMIEIANALLIEQGYEENRAISVAIVRGKEWAKMREIELFVVEALPPDLDEQSH